MRLFDKVLIGNAEACNALREVAGSTTVVCADAIAEHIYMTPKTDWPDGEWSCVRPPWNSAFIEWREPGRMRCGEKLFMNQTDIQQAGFALGVYSRDDFPSTNPLLVDIDKVLKTTKGMTPIDSDILVLGTLFCCVSGVVHAVNCVWILVIESGGQYRMAAAIGPDAARSMDLICNYRLIILMTLAFANCKNVRLADVTDEMQPEPKIRRRLKLPDVRRYTLEIAGHVTRSSRDHNGGPQGVMPFHLCRGHFATYTAEKPMFGNPKLVGRYWHPPHMKGKKENGEIIKDYAIAGGVA